MDHTRLINKVKHPRGNKMDDISGQIFGRLTAQWPVGRHRHGIQWMCLCSCGKLSCVDRHNLKRGTTQSCGCYRRELWKLNRPKYKANYKDGKSKTLEAALLYEARKRAKRKDAYFNLTIDDIVIPDTCPLLGTLIKSSKGKSGRFSANSPSLDRIIPEKGYIKGNVQVISHRANTIKNDASFLELKLIVSNWEKKLAEM